MVRVVGRDREELPEDLRGLWDAFSRQDNDFANQARVLANSPAAFGHLYGLVAALGRNSRLPPRLIEVAVVTTSRINQCAYCVAHHGTAAVRHGLPQLTVERILEPDVPGLTEPERLVRDYARLVAERAWGIPEDVFDKLRAHFTQSDIVELTVRVCLTGLFNRFNQAMEVELEDSSWSPWIGPAPDSKEMSQE
ncbi:MAG: carboxymuconolactone decarboxylase family protein [Hyphomicrobiaceae bacterium]